MTYYSAAQMAAKWHLAPSTVRRYCAEGRIKGAVRKNRIWQIPADSAKPCTSTKITLLSILQREQKAHLSGGIYHRVQIDLTYNSNHIEGSCLTHDQTRYIFETNTIGISQAAINVDDIIETTNHFRCIDYIIEHAEQKLSENFIRHLHNILKSGTSDSRKDWFAVGEYKKLPNEVGGQATAAPKDVSRQMQNLLRNYNQNNTQTLQDIIAFHVQFEKIHPFQDGNGRVGRLIMFKECLKYNIVPFIIGEDLKLFYYRGLHEWHSEQGYLIDTCLSAQDRFKRILDYFCVPYAK